MNTIYVETLHQGDVVNHRTVDRLTKTLLDPTHITVHWTDGTSTYYSTQDFVTKN